MADQSSTDDLAEELDFKKLIPVIGRGFFDEDGQRIKATYVVVDDSAITLTLADGRRVSAPLEWYPRLELATPAERNNWELRSGGRVIIWKSLRLGLSAKALIDGTKSTETATELKHWMASRK